LRAERDVDNLLGHQRHVQHEPNQQNERHSGTELPA